MLDLRAAAAAAQSVAAQRSDGAAGHQHPLSARGALTLCRRDKLTANCSPGAGHDGVNDGVNDGGHEDTRHGGYSQQKAHRGTPTGRDFHRANEKGGDAARRRLFTQQPASVSW